MLDVVVVPERRRRPAGDVPAQVRLGFGGQAANVAVRLSRRGERVRLIAPIADDAGGGLIRAGLAHEGVRTVSLPAVRSAAVVVLLDPGGERTMLSDRRPLHAAAAAAALRAVDWVHCSGYALFDEAAGEALSAALGARRRALRLSVGGGSLAPDPARAAGLRGRIRAAAPQVCILSRDEAASLLGDRLPAGPADAAARLAELAELVVVTAGPDGSVASFGGRIHAAPAATVPGEVVDATGAGDAYAAALLATVAARPWPPRAVDVRRAMAAGARLGARVARVMGAQGWVSGERRPAT